MPSKSRDFLIGSADRYTALDEADLKTLVGALDDAQAAGVKVVLAPISLPGARWKQLNGDKTTRGSGRTPRSRSRPLRSGARSRSGSTATPRSPPTTP
jgi:hypothetical protein